MDFPLLAGSKSDSGVLCGLILWSLKGEETQERVLFLKAVKSNMLKKKPSVM